MENAMLFPGDTIGIIGDSQNGIMLAQECLNCHKRHRADKLEESYAEKHGDKLPENGLKDIVCPDCGTRGNVSPSELPTKSVML